MALSLGTSSIVRGQGNRYIPLRGAGVSFPLGQANYIDVLFHISAQFLSETCRLNCYYHLPSNDMPTFNGCSTVDLLSVYSIC